MRRKNYRSSDYARISVKPLRRGKRRILVTLTSYHNDKFAARFKSRREFEKWYLRHVDNDYMRRNLDNFHGLNEASYDKARSWATGILESNSQNGPV